VQVAPRRERLEDVAVAGREACQPEDRDLRRKVHDTGLLLQHLTRPLQPLRRSGLPDPRPQAPPQPPLPLLVRRLLRRRPRPHGVRPVQRISVEQLRQMPHGRKAPRPLQRIRASAGPPRCAAKSASTLAQALVHHLEQRPHRPLGKPRIRLGLHARRGGHGRADEPPRGRELHVRANPVGRPSAPEPSRQLLGDPPLHAARRHGHDLVGERIAGRRGEQRPQRLDEPVGAG
jgi:hypothetical protein